MIVPSGLGLPNLLNVRLGFWLDRRLVGFLDQAPRGRRLAVGNHQPGVGEVDSNAVARVAKDFDPDALGLQDGSQQVSLHPVPRDDDGPALDAHRLPAYLRADAGPKSASVVAGGRDHGRVVG